MRSAFVTSIRIATKIEPQLDEEKESFTITPDMQQLIDLRTAAGQFTKLDTDEAIHKFTREFNTWVKAGSPRPKMPELITEQDPVPMKLYRIKYMGKQKIFWRDTKNILHGKEIIKSPIMKVAKNPITGEDMEVVERYDQKVNYTIDYSKPLGEKLVADAIDRCFNPTFYFIMERNKYSVNSVDFNRNLDDVWKQIRSVKAGMRID